MTKFNFRGEVEFSWRRSWIFRGEVKFSWRRWILVTKWNFRDEITVTKLNFSWRRNIFPKDSYLGELRLFLRVQAAASASPLIFRRRLGYVRWISISRDPRGAQDFDWVALPGFWSRNSLAATRPRVDFIYTEMAARRQKIGRSWGSNPGPHDSNPVLWPLGQTGPYSKWGDFMRGQCDE